MSWRVMETLRKLAPAVEVYSVDESFFDLAGIDESQLTEYALLIKHTTELWTGIPVSIGIAPTKVLSKVATYIARVTEKLRRQNNAAKTISVFVLTNDQTGDYSYKPATRSLFTTLPFASSLTNLLISYALPLVDQLYHKGSRYLKAGVIVSGIVPDNAIQYNIFDPPFHHQVPQLMKVIENLNFSMRKISSNQQPRVPNPTGRCARN